MTSAFKNLDLRKPPTFLAGLTTFDDEDVVGFRALTEHGPICPLPCLAEGSSPHSHAVVVGYQLVTNKGIYQFDTSGLCVRSSSLHPC